MSEPDAAPRPNAALAEEAVEAPPFGASDVSGLPPADVSDDKA